MYTRNNNKSIIYIYILYTNVMVFDFMIIKSNLLKSNKIVIICNM